MELLAPAGNMESLIAAVQGGADAVYLGLNNFSARAFAGNFNHEEFKEAIKYCHCRDVKVYVTLNTALDEDEFNNIIKELEFIYKEGVDAVLVQDFGLFHYIKNCYEDLEVHASTQMHVHNLAGIEYMKIEGIKRIVLARETPIDIIKEACKLGVEIEVFGYGAICISYSGQCLMSSALKHRSANKGLCAQFCRMKYYKEDGKHFDDGDYIFSPKDLNILDNLKEIYEAGVTSIKIEGRMKRKEYVYLVTKTFREAIDALMDNKEYIVSKKRLEELSLLFNRQYSKGHIFKDNIDARMNHFRGNHLGIEIGEIIEVKKNKVKVLLHKDLHQNDGLRIISEPFDIGLTAVKIEKDKKLVKEAYKNDFIWLDYNDDNSPKKGNIIIKTSDIKLLEEINKQIDSNKRKSKINIKYTGFVNRPFTLLIEDENSNAIYKETDYILDKANNKPISKDDIYRSLSKIKDTAFEIDNIDGELQNVFIPVSVLNNIRREAIEDLINLKSKINRKNKKEYLFSLKDKTTTTFKNIIINSDNLKEEEKYELIKETPIVNENLIKEDHNKMILNEIGDLNGINSHCLAGMSLNIMNSYAIAFFLDKEGIEGIIFSSELNNEQIKKALVSFENRYGFKPITYRLTYGKRNLMIIKNGFINEKVDYIKDYHGNLFKIEYKNNNVYIIEPKNYHINNEYCYGDYLIIKDNQEDINKIIELIKR